MGLTYEDKEESDLTKFITIKDGIFTSKDETLPKTNVLSAIVKSIGSKDHTFNQNSADEKKVKYLNVQLVDGEENFSLGINSDTFMARTFMNCLLATPDIKAPVKIRLSTKEAGGITYTNTKIYQNGKQVPWKYEFKDMGGNNTEVSNRLGQELKDFVSGKPKREAQVVQPAINDSFNNQPQQQQNPRYEVTGNIPPTKVSASTEDISDSNFEDDIPF